MALLTGRTSLPQLLRMSPRVNKLMGFKGFPICLVCCISFVHVCVCVCICLCVCVCMLKYELEQVPWESSKHVTHVLYLELPFCTVNTDRLLWLEFGPLPLSRNTDTHPDLLRVLWEVNMHKDTEACGAEVHPV